MWPALALAALCPFAGAHQGTTRAPLRHTAVRALRMGPDNDGFSLGKAVSGFLGKVDEEMWDFVYGKRDRQWNPDRRSDEEKKRGFDIDGSSLSWGGLQSAEEFVTFKKVQLPEDAPAEMDVGKLIDESGSEPSAVLEAVLGQRTRGAPMTGRELAELCFAKYTRYHDMAIITSTPFGKSNRQVALNIYGPSLGFGSFRLTEEMYLEKLDVVAAALNDWEQADFVRDFFFEAIKPRRGLPSRPRPDTAVTLRLNTSPTWSRVPPEKIESYWMFL